MYYKVRFENDAIHAPTICDGNDGVCFQFGFIFRLVSTLSGKRLLERW